MSVMKRGSLLKTFHFSVRDVWNTKSPWPDVDYINITRTSYVTSKKWSQQTSDKFANLETFRSSCHRNCHRHQTVCEKIWLTILSLFSIWVSRCNPYLDWPLWFTFMENFVYLFQVMTSYAQSPCLPLDENGIFNHFVFQRCCICTF